MIYLINGQLVEISPDTIRMLDQYRTWPAWRRWLWRRGWIG